MKPHVIKFFHFLEAKEGKTAHLPLKIKLLNPGKFKITKDDLDVYGSLDLPFTNITTLPKGLRLYGYLDLKGCASLTSLPDGLNVGWNLNLTGCSSLTSLPDGLKVGWNLFLKNTPLAEMYNADEIRTMIEATGGYVGRDIYV